MKIPIPLKNAIARLSPAQRQWAMLAVVLTVAIGLLWTVFSVTQKTPPKNLQQAGNTPPSKITNIGVMAGGAQVTPVDQWVGNAGRKLAQYEHDKQDQEKLNKDHADFQNRTMQRFAELEETLRTRPNQMPPSPIPQPVTPASPTQPASANLPPPPPTKVTGQPNGMPPGVPGDVSFSGQAQPVTALVRLSLVDPTKMPVQDSSPSSGSTKQDKEKLSNTTDNYLPVSFTRGILLGGLDAPTGGQSQSDPHPVLIRLADSAVLPNRFRSDVKECFVIAAGYGDISSERAYLRTENLSCVRNDGSTLEVKIQGAVYGEDGKVGVRGRLVTKQGQILANALLSGIVGGIGQGFSQGSSTISTSSLGTIATTEGNQVFERGIGTGVGKALDRLAQYYIKLAEQTFPVIEIDAGRQIDVVITKGVRIGEGKVSKSTADNAYSLQTTNNISSHRTVNDEDY